MATCMLHQNADLQIIVLTCFLKFEGVQSYVNVDLALFELVYVYDF